MGGRRARPLGSAAQIFWFVVRRQPTEAEKQVWELLRNRRCPELKFRRQQVIEGYVVDFCCAQLRLALEVDGPIDDEPLQAARDTRRDADLAKYAVDVVRIRNDEASAERLKALLAGCSQRLRGPPR